MKILVLNCGSSSIKYKLYDMDTKAVLSAGNVVRIGLPGAHLKLKVPFEKKVYHDIPNHEVGLELVFSLLTDEDLGAIRTLDEIDAVGHRIVHGGKFTESVELTPSVLKEWKEYSDLAPLHNPASLLGIEAISKKLPHLPQIGVFDTSFHQTMPDYAYRYAIPTKYYERYGIRRYGFHGTSHRYVLHRAAEFLGFDPAEKNVISCHIGNGASVCAIKHGKCVDTSMGLTPLEGLVMGTRSGDIDPSAILYIMDKERMTPREASDLLNKQSGMLALSGVSSDMAEIGKAAREGNKRARMANKIYNYRLKKYICAYMGVLGGADYILFTAGVGEHQWDMRRDSVAGLEFMGIKLDDELNRAAFGTEAIISAPDSKVTVAVIPTDEELLVAEDTLRIVQGL
ncbi:MAG: acetate kinase [Prevotellaceae bacterium]|nr:acetate kinase [Prevotellaceae bacterium]MDY3856932.1 acetate kinase [Bacteroidaceae bacterium]